MASTNYNEEYYKVAFVTTHSSNLPNLLKYTGSLIVMSDLSQKDPTTNKNRMSIWLRGECLASGWGFSSSYLMTNGTWWANAYNRIFGPNGAQEFDPESEYNKGNGTDSDSYTSTTRPISISNKINYTYNFINTTKKELEKSISDASSSTSAAISYTNNWINNAISKHNQDVDFINGYMTAYKVAAYNYTDYRIEKLVGGAPDVLDTLGEISYWLKNAQQLGIDTVTQIMDIKTSYVTHEECDANGYTYISTYSYQMVRDEKPQIGYVYAYTWTPNTDGSYTKEWKKTEDTYEYYGYNPVKTGTLALNPDQVTTPFSYHNLYTILKRIITPYDYRTPSLTCSEVNDIDAYTWMETPAPVGSSITNVKSIFDVNNNDAIEVTSATINGTSKIITTGGTTVEFPISIDEIKLGQNIWASSYTTSYGNAVHQEYPQLVGLDPKVYDEDHAFTAGFDEKSFTQYVYKVGKYECYAGQDCDVTDMTTFLVDLDKTIVGTKFFLDGDENTGTGTSLIVNQAKTSTITWLLVPNFVSSSDNFEVLIVDENTKIEQSIWKGTSSEYASDIVSVTNVPVNGTHYGMSFSKILLKSKRYPFSNSFKFKVNY